MDENHLSSSRPPPRPLRITSAQKNHSKKGNAVNSRALYLGVALLPLPTLSPPSESRKVETRAKGASGEFAEINPMMSGITQGTKSKSDSSSQKTESAVLGQAGMKIIHSGRVIHLAQRDRNEPIPSVAKSQRRRAASPPFPPRLAGTRLSPRKAPSARQAQAQSRSNANWPNGFELRGGAIPPRSRALAIGCWRRLFGLRPAPTNRSFGLTVPGIDEQQQNTYAREDRDRGSLREVSGALRADRFVLLKTNANCATFFRQHHKRCSVEKRDGYL